MERAMDWDKPVRGRILVVDDDRMILDAYRYALGGDSLTPENDYFGDTAAEAGHAQAVHDTLEASFASQGMEGIALAQAALAAGDPYGVVFIDMRMPPGIDGLETARRLREMDDRIYLVVVTAYSDHSVDELQAALHHDILLRHKPFAADEIFQMARSLCRSWQRDRQLEAALADTERAAQMEARLLSMSKLAQLGELAAGVAHEINNPLTYISTVVQMLSGRHVPPPEQAQEMLREARHQCDRIASITGQLLSYGRGVRQAQTRPVGWRTVADSTLVLMGHRLRKQSVQVELAYDDAPLWVLGDLTEFEQILINLLQNSIDAMTEQGRQDGHIRIDMREESDADGKVEVRIRYEDDGPGMSAEVLAHAFDAFYTTKAEGKGTGLGLSIIRRIAEAHGGTVALASTPGNGVRFQLSFPAYQPG